MDKRVFLAGFVFAVILMSSFVSAQYFLGDLRSVTQSVIDAYVDVGEPVLQALFGGYGGWTGYLLFERFLVFILLLAVIYVALGRFELFSGQKTVRWTVSIIVPLIGIRFIDYAWLEMIFLQYKVVSIIFASIIPFILFFFFVHGLAGDYPVLRKIMWLFFIAVYLGLWTTTAAGIVSQVYFYTVLAAAIALIFDKKIENYIRFRELMKSDSGARWKEVGKINMEIQELNRQIRAGALPAKVGEAEVKKLTKHKTELMKGF